MTMKQLNKITLLLVVCWSALLVSGCDMTRDEVIAAKKECEDAGMAPVILLNGWTKEPRAVRCDIIGN
jgi:hypothetical protein